jgi:hypothetical protein
MTISLRTLALIALAGLLGLAGYLAFLRPETAPATSTGLPASSPVRAFPPAPEPAREAKDVPFGTVDGNVPGTKLTLLSLRRTGPRVVSARLRIDFDHGPDTIWIPSRYESDDERLTAEAMRLVDGVNGREHFVLRNADGACLCSGAFDSLEAGDSSTISAKFPAPPAEVTEVSIETPGFPSFDGVPLP